MAAAGTGGGVSGPSGQHRVEVCAGELAVAAVLDLGRQAILSQLQKQLQAAYAAANSKADDLNLLRAWAQAVERAEEDAKRQLHLHQGAGRQERSPCTGLQRALQATHLRYAVPDKPQRAPAQEGPPVAGRHEQGLLVVRGAGLRPPDEVLLESLHQQCITLSL